MVEATDSRRLLSECGWADEAIPSVKTLVNSISWLAVESGEGDQLVGFLRVLSDNDVVTYIAELAVAEPFRARGVGRLLMAACRDQFRKTRIDVLSSATARPFYEALGYSARPAYRSYG